MNGSLDFLNMIKNHSDTEKRVSKPAPVAEEKIKAPSGKMIAVIDTETNWHDQVMSLGIALGDFASYKLLGKRYYVFEPECNVGGMYSSVMHYGGDKRISLGRDAAMRDLQKFLSENGVEKIFAYNAKFDYNHLPELRNFEWYDIMRLAAYKQYNHAIPDTLACCKTGRLKTNYGVEPITCMLTGNSSYREIHNAVYDAVDELHIMELLGHSIEMYSCAKIG